MAPIKVAHVTTVDLSLRYLLLNQMQSIQEAGYQVYGLSAPGPYVPTLEQIGIRHIAVPFTRSSRLTPLDDLKAFWYLYRLFRREKFTIVHTHTAKPDLYGQLAARLAGVPIVMSTLHGFYFHEHMPSFWYRFYVLLARIGALCSDVILSQNPEDLQTAAREHICPSTKIKYLGNGIDVQRFDRAQIDLIDLKQLRKELGIAQDAQVVGFVARLVKDKGIYELLQAAQKVREFIPEARFLLVGMIDPDKRDAVTPEVALEYGLADTCIFTGHREDMPELYALMNVFVLPSHREAFPRVLMEAAAMALPSVVTNVRGCRTVVDDGQTGIIVELKDIDELANAIIHILKSPQQAAKMGLSGRQKAEREFDEQRVFETVKSVYAHLLHQKNLSTDTSQTPLSSSTYSEPTYLRNEQAKLFLESRSIPWKRKASQRLAKRIFDIIIATLMLFLLLPLMIILVVLVRVTSTGPIFFRQTRIGLDGKPFTMVKFRTMHALYADGSAGIQGEVTTQDSRLTPIGAFLRSWRLDELPQLIHVVSGHMSLVGPRPDIPENVPLYTQEQILRFAMPPGCTAWTFTRGAFANDWGTRQDINVEYVQQWSFWLDIKIIVGSLIVLLMQRNVNPETRS